MSSKTPKVYRWFVELDSNGRLRIAVCEGDNFANH